MIPFFTPGKRTIIMSVASMAMALLLQADHQEVINLAPMLRLVLTFGLTITVPLVPVFIRKAIDKSMNQNG